MTAIMQPLQCDLQPQIQETHKTTHTGATTRCRTQRRNQFRGKPACLDTHMATKRGNNHVAIPLQPQIPKHPLTTHAQAHPKQLEATVTVRQKKGKPTAAATAANRRYVSSPTAATLHGKTQGFALRLPPQSKAHATFMQPLQCVLQHHVANPHVSTHMATKRDNNHVAIPLRSATTDSKTTHAQAHPKQSHCYSAAKKKANRPQPQPPHTRGTFHRRPKPLYTEKYNFSCSGFLPNTSPMQRSCSHYNAFRSITSQTCTYLCTWQRQMTTIMQPFHCDLQPQIQDTHRTTLTGTTTRCRTQRRYTFADETTAAATAAHKRYLSSPAAATLHGKIQGFVPWLPPQHKPHATFMQPLQSHHFPKSPLPFVTTSHRHHFPSSPLPFVTTSLNHHFPKSPLPKVTTLPLSPPPFVTTSLSLTPPFINVNSFVMYCYVMSSLTLPFINVNSFVMYCYVMSSRTPPFINVNSFVMYCYVMSSLTPPSINVNSFCQVSHHPSSVSILL